MPFRLGEADWYELVYHRSDGMGRACDLAP
jgi:hypothetical protein